MFARRATTASSGPCTPAIRGPPRRRRPSRVVCVCILWACDLTTFLMIFWKFARTRAVTRHASKRAKTWDDGSGAVVSLACPGILASWQHPVYLCGPAVVAVPPSASSLPACGSLTAGSKQSHSKVTRTSTSHILPLRNSTMTSPQPTISAATCPPSPSRPGPPRRP